MTAASPPGRAAALHRRAMDGVAEAGGPEAPAHPRRRAADAEPAPLPGAGVLVIASVGLALGLAATAVVVTRGWDPGAVAVGPWVSRPKVGTPAIDPYARAELARTGAVPMAASEGLSFTAATDDTGYRLLRTCSYRMSGDVPAARFWTLTAADRAGIALDDGLRRSAMASTDVIRGADGRFTVEVGPAARPGNWMPLSGAGPMTLTLRLYDTPLTGAAAEVGGAALPSIARQGCAGVSTDGNADTKAGRTTGESGAREG